MRKPTKNQWQVVIDNLRKVLPMAERDGGLDMFEGRVNELDHQCGTIHCVGGWYAVAALNTSLPLTYLDGTNAIALALGFEDDDDLEKFLLDNPDYWGNMAGKFIFCAASAYYQPDKRPYGATNLLHVIEHFEEVRDRSPE